MKRIVFFIAIVLIFVSCSKDESSNKSSQSTTRMKVDYSNTDRYFSETYINDLKNATGIDPYLLSQNNEFITYSNALNSLNSCFIDNYQLTVQNDPVKADLVKNLIQQAQTDIANGDTTSALDNISNAYSEVGCFSSEYVKYKDEEYNFPAFELGKQQSDISIAKASLIEVYPELENIDEQDFQDLIVIATLYKNENNGKATNQINQLPPQQDCKTVLRAKQAGLILAYSLCCADAAMWAAFPVVSAAYAIGCTGVFVMGWNSAYADYNKCMQ